MNVGFLIQSFTRHLGGFSSEPAVTRLWKSWIQLAYRLTLTHHTALPSPVITRQVATVSMY